MKLSIQEIGCRLWNLMLNPWKLVNRTWVGVSGGQNVKLLLLRRDEGVR